jgi:hypothetical protein
MTDTLTIAPVRVINGHTSAETAYLVPDYPYGRLRCKIRYWVETATKGSGKGEQRWVSQTTNPKVPGEVWNKPKASTYSALVAMYLDEKDHVQAHHVPFWITGEVDTRTRAMGVYDDFTEDQRKKYDALLSYSRRVNPTTWAEWDAKVAKVAGHIRDVGAELEITNGKFWADDDGKPVYLGDPAAVMTAARALLASGLI